MSTHAYGSIAHSECLSGLLTGSTEIVGLDRNDLFRYMILQVIAALLAPLYLRRQNLSYDPQSSIIEIKGHYLLKHGRYWRRFQ